MAKRSCQSVDPRIRRTRELLQQALQKILEKREFDEISVQDIAAAATVNRATFYDHYADKFALLQSMVASEFDVLLAEREVQFDQSCSSTLKAIVLAVCDYLALMQGRACRRQLQPHTESAIIAAVRRVLLDGLKLHPQENAASPEMIAAAGSWAIYGAAKEWVQTPDRGSSEGIADIVTALISPIFRERQSAGG